VANENNSGEQETGPVVSEIRRLWPVPDSAPLADEALAACYPSGGPPRLRVNFVSSIDGAVTVDGYSAGLSSPGDKRVFNLLRASCDALLVGAGTLRHEGYHALRPDGGWRKQRGLSPYPVLVVVSGSLDLDPAQAAFADAPVRPVIVTHAGAPARPDLAAVADILTCGDTTVDLAAAVAALHARGLTQLLCEGGPTLFGGLTAADLVDEVCLTIAPLLVGPGAGRITAGPPGPPRSMTARHILATDGQLLLRYVRG
jgi:riboflavin biosynthesis pyrimidine reductase